jgi:CheY-like chemotaxis protein
VKQPRATPLAEAIVKEPGRILDESEGSRTAAPCKQDEPPGGTSTRSGRVLVIDDEPMLADIIAQALSDAHDVEVVTGGREAIDRVLSGRDYDVILCDVSMPGMHGLAVHAEIVRIQPDYASRFVFMSGGVSDGLLMERLAALPNLLVQKPFECRRIQRIVDDRVHGHNRRARSEGAQSGPVGQARASARSK